MNWEDTKDDNYYSQMGRIFLAGVFNDQRDFVSKFISKSDDQPTPEVLVGIANALHEIKEYVEELDSDLASDIGNLSNQMIYSSCDCKTCRRKDR